MIRITGGEFCGRMIASPQGKDIRPTTGRVRESLFNQLRDRMAGCRFLDLFSGSGLMGIEALSRGAAFVLAVEKNRRHVDLVQENYEKLGLSPQIAQVVCQDVVRFVQQPCPEAFQVIYLDPPYGYVALPGLVDQLIQQNWLARNGVFIAEQRIQDPDIPQTVIKRFGDTKLSFFQPAD